MGGSHGSGPAVDGVKDAPAPLRAIMALSTLCGWIAAGMIVAAIFITCQMIFVRYALNWSTIWQTEAVTYLMIGATLVGLPYVQKLRGHVNVDALPRMLPPAGRFALALVVKLTSIAVITLMAFYGYEYWHEAWDWGETSNTPWDIKLWIPYLALPIGFGLFWLQLLADLALLILGYEAPFGLDDAHQDAAIAERARMAEYVE